MKLPQILAVVALLGVISYASVSSAEPPLPPGMRRASDPAPPPVQVKPEISRARIELAIEAGDNVLSAVGATAQADDIVLNRRAVFLTDAEAAEARRLVDTAYRHRCAAIEKLKSNQP